MKTLSIITRLQLLTLLVIVGLILSPTLCSAVPIANLYNTGLDGLGNYLPANAPDGNYSVVTSPLGTFTPVAVDDSLYPFPLWVANNPNFSRWIGTSNQSSNGPAGVYTYRTSFNLPANADLNSVVITGLWATDDPGLNILVNSTPNGQTSIGHTALVPFTLTTGFQIGNNDIDFIVQNGPSSTGLRVDSIAGNYNLIPEPGSFLLGTSCLGSLVMRRRWI